ncbi:MAG TPA: tetratricopeptide repeat protein [Ktedonobacteraceae bacterium]
MPGLLLVLTLAWLLVEGIRSWRTPRFIRDGVYRNRAQCAYALDYFTRSLARHPQDWETYLKRGEAFFFLKNYQQAISDYTHALALHPHDESILLRRSRAYFNTRNYDETIWDCTRALDINPYYSPAYGMRGRAYFASDEYERAANDYSRAIEMNPENAQNYANRGHYYLRIMELEQARADWQRSWDLKPAVSIGLMLNWLKLSRDETEKNIAIASELEKVAALDPRSAQALLCLGIALYLRQAYTEGLAKLTRAAASEPESALISFWQGMILATLQRNMQADQAFLRTSDLGLPKALWQPITRLDQQTQTTYWSY